VKFKFRGDHEGKGDYDHHLYDVIDFTDALYEDGVNPTETLEDTEENSESEIFQGYAREAKNIHNHRQLGKN
jgi:hypothetical protein